MSTIKQAPSGQLGLTGFGTGSMVSLDGGKRLRLDDVVDFWPATGVWHAIDGEENGVGATSLMAFLKQAREQAGQPVTRATPLQSNRRVSCNYCHRPAELHGGLAVYPDRKELAERQFWVCWQCNAWVGCHRDSDKPFGELANEELRDGRIAAHAAFDPLWQQGRMSRPAAYEWLADSMGLLREDCHIGLMSVEECRRVVQLVWEHFESFGDVP